MHQQTIYISYNTIINLQAQKYYIFILIIFCVICLKPAH
jgi:hypothetical protein